MSEVSVDEVETCLFVYGTLAPGQSNAHILAPLNGSWEPATVRGYLFPEGCEGSFGYPALVLAAADDRGAGPAPGQLFRATGLPAFWAELDAFEGSAYCRVITEVTTASGATVNAYTYELNRAAANPFPVSG